MPVLTRELEEILLSLRLIVSVDVEVGCMIHLQINVGGASIDMNFALDFYFYDLEQLNCVAWRFLQLVKFALYMFCS